MNKSQFVEAVQTAGGYKTKIEAEKAISAFTEAVTNALVAKEDVALIGFGTFKTGLQKGKSGKIPNTDRTYQTEDKTIPKFSAGSTLKSRVESGK